MLVYRRVESRPVRQLRRAPHQGARLLRSPPDELQGEGHALCRTIDVRQVGLLDLHTDVHHPRWGHDRDLLKRFRRQLHHQRRLRDVPHPAGRDVSDWDDGGDGELLPDVYASGVYNLAGTRGMCVQHQRGLHLGKLLHRRGGLRLTGFAAQSILTWPPPSRAATMCRVTGNHRRPRTRGGQSVPGITLF